MKSVGRPDVSMCPMHSNDCINAGHYRQHLSLQLCRGGAEEE